MTGLGLIVLLGFVLHIGVDLMQRYAVMGVFLLNSSQKQRIRKRPLCVVFIEIRGYKVMLDSDLAELYNVETKNLKRAVRANIERFPDDFMFELTKEEYESLRCKNFTLKSEENENALRCKNFTSNNRGGNRYLPFAFTREGIAMLSGLKVFLLAEAYYEVIMDFLPGGFGVKIQAGAQEAGGIAQEFGILHFLFHI